MTGIIKPPPARTRWSCRAQKLIERPDIDIFIDEIIAVCERHGFGLSYDDTHDGLKVVTYDTFDPEWISDAHDDTGAAVAS